MNRELSGWVTEGRKAVSSNRDDGTVLGVGIARRKEQGGKESQEQEDEDSAVE